jgi:hypothetical protein
LLAILISQPDRFRGIKVSLARSVDAEKNDQYVANGNKIFQLLKLCDKLENFLKRSGFRPKMWIYGSKGVPGHQG